VLVLSSCAQFDSKFTQSPLLSLVSIGIMQNGLESTHLMINYAKLLVLIKKNLEPMPPSASLS
jgi:hypothetical protein